MLAARVAGVAFQAMAGEVVPLSVSVNVPPVMVPAKVMVWTAAVVDVPGVVVATLTPAPVPVSLLPSAVMVACTPGDWKVAVKVPALWPGATVRDTRLATG